MKRKASIFIGMIFIFTLVVALLSVAIVAAIPSENKKGSTSPVSDLNRVESFFSSIAFSYENGAIELDYGSGRDKPAPAHARFSLNPGNFLAQRSFWFNFFALIFLLTALFWVFVELISLSMLAFSFIEAIGAIPLKGVERILLKRQILSKPIGYQSKHARQTDVFVSS